MACRAVAREPRARLRPEASARQPSLASRAKAVGPGRTRTCNQTVMSRRVTRAFVDVPTFSSRIDHVRCVLERYRTATYVPGCAYSTGITATQPRDSDATCPSAVRRGCALDAERCGEASNTNRRHDERAAIPDMLDPIVLKSVTKNGSADRPGQMRSALAPVETGAAEHSALGGEAKIGRASCRERV